MGQSCWLASLANQQLFPIQVFLPAGKPAIYPILAFSVHILLFWPYLTPCNFIHSLEDRKTYMYRVALSSFNVLINWSQNKDTCLPSTNWTDHWLWCMIKSEDVLKTRASESEGNTKELMSNLQYISTLKDVLQSLIKTWCTQSQDVKEVNELPTCNL